MTDTTAPQAMDAEEKATPTLTDEVNEAIKQNRKYVLTLSEPVKLGDEGETITALHFRKPKAKDFRSMPLEIKMGDMLDLAARISGQPGPVIDLLGTDDMFKVMEVVGAFMPAGLPTGTTA